MDIPCRELPFFYFDDEAQEWLTYNPSSEAKESKAESQRPQLDLGKDLVVLQYNIWFGEFQYRRRMEAIIEEVCRLEADIVCVQEMKPHMLKVFLEAPAIRASFFLSDIDGSTLGSYGVMQFSRYPYQRLTLNAMVTRLGRKALVGEFLLPSGPTGVLCGTCGVSFTQDAQPAPTCSCPQPWSPGKLDDCPSGPSDSDGVISGDEDYEEEAIVMGEPPVRRNVLAVATAHLESYPQDVSYRRAQMLRIFDILKPFEHAIFTADFNFAEVGEDGFFPPQFTDSYKALHPDDEGYTFDSVNNPLIREQKTKRSRIDRILVKSSRWRPASCQIVGKEPFDSAYPLMLPSDHFGVTAHLECSPGDLL